MKSTNSPKFTIAAILASSFLASSCGGGGEGGNSIQSATVTEFSASDQYVLNGDWPLESTTRSFLVSSDDEWQQTWKSRRAALSCSSAVPYNEQACGADSPPIVDFSRYSVVGILLSPAYYFRTPNPTRVAIDVSNNTLILEYSYSNPHKAPFYYQTNSRFFLVPKTNAQLSSRPGEV